MLEMLRYLKLKLQQEKGEVSVEWALVAVIMTLIIATVFLPGVRGGLDTAMTTIVQKLQSSSAPAAN